MGWYEILSFLVASFLAGGLVAVAFLLTLGLPLTVFVVYKFCTRSPGSSFEDVIDEIFYAS